MEKDNSNDLIYNQNKMILLQQNLAQYRNTTSSSSLLSTIDSKNSSQLNPNEFSPNNIEQRTLLINANSFQNKLPQWNTLNYAHQNIPLLTIPPSHNIMQYGLSSSHSLFNINYQNNYNQFQPMSKTWNPNNLYRIDCFNNNNANTNDLNQNVNENSGINTNVYTLFIENLGHLIVDEKEIKTLKIYFNSFTLEQLIEILRIISSHFLQIAKNLSGVRNINNLIDYIHLKGGDLTPILQLVLQNFNEIFLDVNARKIIRQLLNFHMANVESSICMQIAMNLLTLINDKEEKSKKEKDKTKTKKTHKSKEIDKLQQGNPAPQYILKILSPYKENKTNNIHNLSPINRDIIAKSIINNAKTLSKGRYGSCLIMGIFEDYKLYLMNTLLPDFVELSTNKYSSRIIEKMFKSTEPKIKNTIYSILNKNILTKLACDHYGNYVIQKAVEYAPNEQMVKQLLDMCAEIVIEHENDRYCVILSGQLSGQHKYFKTKRKDYRDGYNRVKGIIKGD